MVILSSEIFTHLPIFQGLFILSSSFFQLKTLIAIEQFLTADELLHSVNSTNSKMVERTFGHITSHIAQIQMLAEKALR